MFGVMASMMPATTASITKLPHHEQLEFCMTRAKYRQGRKLTAVRVYTVNDESRYLILDGVSSIKISSELERLCQRYGDIDFLKMLPNYPHDDYVEVYLVKYKVLKNARFAKKQLDGKSFFGQVLHVFYAPELETVDETREKLQDRRKTIAALTRYRQDSGAQNLTREPRVMPPTAVRYMNQLRPDLRKENLNRLHPRVDKSVTNNNGEDHVHGDGTQDMAWASSHSREISEVCDETPTEEEGPSAPPATSAENVNLKNVSYCKSSRSTAEPIEEVLSVNLSKDKRRSELCTLPTKRIKIFGNKKLFSFKQD